MLDGPNAPKLTGRNRQLKTHGAKAAEEALHPAAMAAVRFCLRCAEPYSPLLPI